MYGDDAQRRGQVDAAEKEAISLAVLPLPDRGVPVLCKPDARRSFPSPFEALAFTGSHITTLILIPCSASACFAFQRKSGVTVAGDFVSSQTDLPFST